MVNADQTITIFNIRVNKETRREMFVPTTITGVSFYDVQSTSVASRIGESARNEEMSCKIRIPIGAGVQNKRTYIPEEQYKELSDEKVFNYWTIQKGCYVIGGTVTQDDVFFTKEEVDAMVRLVNTTFSIVVKEYADNTKRGTDAVRHWRIGGA